MQTTDQPSQPIELTPNTEQAAMPETTVHALGDAAITAVPVEQPAVVSTPDVIFHGSGRSFRDPVAGAHRERPDGRPASDRAIRILKNIINMTGPEPLDLTSAPKHR